MANTQKEVPVISTEEINAKAQSLSTKHNTRVTPIVFFDEDTNEKIVGYVKEPARLAKQRAMDKMITSASSAGEDILNACLIKEESNVRILSELPEDDSIFLGACNACLSIVKVKQNIAKKN